MTLVSIFQIHSAESELADFKKSEEEKPGKMVVSEIFFSEESV